MRDGYCTENQDDRGSHHICINLSSTEGGNFCDVTGQPDWVRLDEERRLERSDSKSAIPPSYITRLERSDNKNSIAYRLSSRNSFSLSLRSSHIPPSYITNNFPLVASLRSLQCSSQMGCHEDYRGKQCPVEHWCVCQWAFASYIENAGGCGMIQDIVCDATNKKALEAYARENDNDERIGRALECIVERCGIGGED